MTGLAEGPVVTRGSAAGGLASAVLVTPDSGVDRPPDGLTMAGWQAEIARRFPSDPSLVIPVLQLIQGVAGYLPEAAIRAAAAHLRVSPAHVFGVASFYAGFHFEPRGSNTITVCRGTACHVRGSAAVLRALEDHLGIGAGGTTPDLRHTLETAACFGSCALAPVIVANGRAHGRQTAASARALADGLVGGPRAPAIPAPGSSAGTAMGEGAPPDEPPQAPGLHGLVWRIAAAKDQWRLLHGGGQSIVTVGTATCGLAAGAGEVLQAVRRELATPAGPVAAAVPVQVVTVGCLGLCYAEPLLDIDTPGLPRIVYGRVTPDAVAEILAAHLVRREPLATWALGSIGERPIPGIPPLEDLPVLRGQVRLALRNCGVIDPTDIDQYLARDGYAGLRRAVASWPDEVIEEVKASGLRGRGGGGFPTGAKWELCRAAPGTEKVVICNADEGDPGAFMDRSLLEGDPHAVLEGLAIAAYAIGATRGCIYVRAEYPLAIERLEVALGQMRELGLLGTDILGSGFSFDIDIRQGAGAFVCGEETALIASLEGRRGLPRPRPPYPAVRGLFGRPSNINNVETLANVASILREGAAWFSGFGTVTSKGTKTFALTGKVKRPGLIEVPMGISLREVVNDIGGGIAGGGRFKAAQTGGPSGGCIPARLLDLPIDYERLKEAGSIMGSGGLVILDESTCMVDLARYFLAFTCDESCGQCTPCREGTVRMRQILERICGGTGRPEDLPLLEKLAGIVHETSLCGLGQTAPNPVITTLRYFRDEYEEHVEQRYCRAGACAALVAAPCTNRCPAGVEAHRYVRLVQGGRFEDAYLVVRERMPLPSVCGAVCFRPCESGCRRGELDERVAIRALKAAAVRFGGQAEARVPPPSRPASGRSVGVIGSGPAGLTAAYYLARLGGHAVTVYEALPEAGGMLRYGIPRYRLSAELLERDLDIVRQAGVRIVTDAQIDSLAVLRERHDAVFVATGAPASAQLHLGGLPPDGRPLAGMLDCIPFLRDVASGSRVALGDRVAVVGGGNSAIDAARTARRLGAREVTILYRRDRDQMPADAHEIADALAEGVRLETLVAPVAIRRSGVAAESRTGMDPVVGEGAHEPSGSRTAEGGDSGPLELTCQRMRLGDVDADGRRRPVPVPGTETTALYDTVLLAIGQHPQLPEAWGLDAGPDDRVTVSPRGLATCIGGVFAGGDVVLGPATVIEAIAHGRAAASEIDRYLGGSGSLEERFVPAMRASNDVTALDDSAEADAGARTRVPMPVVDAGTRIVSFTEVELGYSRDEAIEEAGRCLRCDLREVRV